MTEESSVAQLIVTEINHPEVARIINDIRDFDWAIISKLRKTELDRVKATGFRFRTKGKESQQKEFASFLIEHPSVMASDFEMIISKLQIFARLIGEQTSAPAITHDKQKPKKKRVIVIEEEEDEEFVPSEPSEDSEEDVREIPRRKNGKPFRWY